MKRARILVATVFACVALTGCAVLHPVDLTVYSLSLERESSQAAVTRNWQLIVAPPLATAPLDGARILVMPHPGEIEFYKDARWRDSAPAMLQQLLLESLRDAGGLRGAAVPASGVHADFALRSVLQDFQAEYRDRRVPVVNVRLALQLVRLSDGVVIGASH